MLVLAMAQGTVRGATAWEVNGNLALSRDRALPPVCLKCGTMEGISPRVVELSCRTSKPRSDLLALLAAVPGPSLFVSPFESIEASLRVPICAACDARWTWARRFLSGLLRLAVILVLVVPFWPSMFMAATILALIAARIVAKVVIVPRWMLMAGHIAPDHVFVHDVPERARRALLAVASEQTEMPSAHG
jgi:hypothetical protein